MAAVLASIVVVTSCGSDADPGEALVEPAVDVVVTAVQEGLDGIDDASALACDGDRRAVERAVEAYSLLEGAPPASEADLVPDWLRRESDLFDVVDGNVVAAPGASCD